MTLTAQKIEETLSDGSSVFDIVFRDIDDGNKEVLRLNAVTERDANDLMGALVSKVVNVVVEPF